MTEQKGPTESPSEKRARLVKEWSVAPAKVDKYPHGNFVDPNDISIGTYSFPSGQMLTINGEQVMDTCERPWVAKTVETTFARLEELGIEKPRILIRGFGLGMDSDLVLQNLVKLGGGKLHIMELNHDVAQNAREWAEQMESKLSAELASEVKIYIHEGDSLEVTEQLSKGLKQKQFMLEISKQASEELSASKKILTEGMFKDEVIEKDVRSMMERRISGLESSILNAKAEEEIRKSIEEMKFDAILSDTYPLSEEEAGQNDIQDIKTMKSLLTSEGIFTFFAYFPKSTGGVVEFQRDIIAENFSGYYVHFAAVKPQTGYRYLFDKNCPVRRLPVAVCWDPILEDTK